MRKLLFLLLSVIMMVACGSTDSTEENNTIVLADGDHDSRRIHNSIAQLIIENGYGYDVEILAGSRMATFQGLKDGDIDVELELWVNNIIEAFEEAVDEGKVEKVAINFDDNEQGVYVPTYVIEGDKERGIEPMAPDLRTMEDLKKYPELFEDPEDPGRGRLIGGPASWAVDEILREKVKTYGLDETINYVNPGSDSSLVTSLVKAYEFGEAWAGYYWSPTIITAKYDLTLLEEPPYDEEVWNENKGTEFPPNDVIVVINSELRERAPEVTEFLSNYETSSALTEASLDFMEENDASPEDTAIWWMKEFDDVWKSWVPEDVAEKVQAAIQ